MHGYDIMVMSLVHKVYTLVANMYTGYCCMCVVCACVRACMGGCTRVSYTVVVCACVSYTVVVCACVCACVHACVDHESEC